MNHSTCGYKWFAPVILPSGKEGTSQQECYRKLGHLGDHRSPSGVTTPQIRKEP